MNDINCTTNAKLEKAKGDSAWEEAMILFDKEKYDGAVSRAYYAAFHHSCAALLTKGMEAISHRSLQRLFHLHFIRTKIFPDNVGVLLSHAQKAREEADYFPEVSFTKEIAQDRIQEVKEFLKASSKYLEEAGVK